MSDVSADFVGPAGEVGGKCDEVDDRRPIGVPWGPGVEPESRGYIVDDVVGDAHPVADQAPELQRPVDRADTPAPTVELVEPSSGSEADGRHVGRLQERSSQRGDVAGDLDHVPERGRGGGGEISEVIGGGADEHHRRRVDDVLGGQAEMQELACVVGESRAQDVEQPEDWGPDLPSVDQYLGVDRVFAGGDDCRGGFGGDIARCALCCSDR